MDGEIVSQISFWYDFSADIELRSYFNTNDDTEIEISEVIMQQYTNANLGYIPPRGTSNIAFADFGTLSTKSLTNKLDEDFQARLGKFSLQGRRR